MTNNYKFTEGFASIGCLAGGVYLAFFGYYSNIGATTTFVKDELNVEISCGLIGCAVGGILSGAVGLVIDEAYSMIS